MARTPVLPEATPVGPLSALLRYARREAKNNYEAKRARRQSQTDKWIDEHEHRNSLLACFRAALPLSTQPLESL
jgi:hypothetical protein